MLLRARHEQNHVVPQVLPQKQDGDDHQAVLGFQPVNLVRAKHGEEGIQAAIIVKQHLPNQNDRRNGNHHRTEEEGPKLALERDLAFQNQGQSQRQDDRQGHRHRGEGGGVLDCDLEGGILYDPDKVIQKHKVVIDRALNDRIVDHDAERHDEKHQHPQNTRGQKSDAPQKIRAGCRGFQDLPQRVLRLLKLELWKPNPSAWLSAVH